VCSTCSGISQFDWLHSGQYNDAAQLYALDIVVLDCDDLRPRSWSAGRKEFSWRRSSRRDRAKAVVNREREQQRRQRFERRRTSSALVWAKPAASNLHFLQRCGSRLAFRDVCISQNSNRPSRRTSRTGRFFCFGGTIGRKRQTNRQSPAARRQQGPSFIARSARCTSAIPIGKRRSAKRSPVVTILSER
jgi:hypothetical protein